MKTTDITTSVILASYNQPNCLKRVLAGFAVQRDLNFEMIIADDGSDQDTFVLLEDFQKSAPFELSIVSQNHTSFRKARIQNIAVSKASGDQKQYSHNQQRWPKFTRHRPRPIMKCAFRFDG